MSQDFRLDSFVYYPPMTFFVRNAKDCIRGSGMQSYPER